MSFLGEGKLARSETDCGLLNVRLQRRIRFFEHPFPINWYFARIEIKKREKSFLLNWSLSRDFSFE